ncbi:fad synthetase 1 chloroplastic [Phtheirospermum japonicum]|uniref:FAD synthase n=1 Tax=Phtheirospermum japonicum TaxID=374723 RepID=A0A830BI12_9LAMI|nr:fad synthetase 1 chloroplastic [Phtheirospermum japonicum]
MMMSGLLRFKLLGTSASYSSSSYSSSSSITNNNDDLAGVSFINNASQPPLLSDCLTDPPSEGISSLAGGIVALGKFDALHIGHLELAIQAAKIGVPFLLSFIGMEEIFGWEPRAPIVSKCDRKWVLSSWTPLCGNITPKEFHVEFSKVRYLTPQQFVEKLSAELKISGVVAGENYRFGYRASGDSSDLVRWCKEYGMKASIVNSIMDKKNRQESKDDIDSKNSNEQGQVSSTRVRRALANGDIGLRVGALGT